MTFDPLFFFLGFVTGLLLTTSVLAREEPLSPHRTLIGAVITGLLTVACIMIFILTN